MSVSSSEELFNVGKLPFAMIGQLLKSLYLVDGNSVDLVSLAVFPVVGNENDSRRLNDRNESPLFEETTAESATDDFMLEILRDISLYICTRGKR